MECLYRAWLSAKAAPINAQRIERANNNASKNVQLVDEIMQTVTQTDVWTEELTNDPVIKEAEEEVEAVMEEVRGYIPLELFLRLDEAIAYKAVAYHEPAILYGMRVAYALEDVCRRPSDLSRSVMERVKGARA